MKNLQGTTPYWLIALTLATVVAALVFITLKASVIPDEALHAYGAALLFGFGAATAVLGRAVERTLFKSVPVRGSIPQARRTNWTFVIFLVLVIATLGGHLVIELGLPAGSETKNAAIAVRFLLDAFKVALAGFLTSLTTHSEFFSDALSKGR